MSTETSIMTDQTDEQLRTAAVPAGGWTTRARRSLRRFDRYTLEVLNPGHPYRLSTDRSA